jgi:glycosyltransferase involved in cell wall biosynthesis
MRVMLATGFYPGARMGGAEHQTMLLGRGLLDRGHEVVFLGTDAGSEGKEQVDGIQLWNLPGRLKDDWPVHQKRIAEALREARPDLCYVRLLSELPAFAAPCQDLSTPVVSVSSSLKEGSPVMVGLHARELAANLISGEVFRHIRAFSSIRSSAAHVCISRELQQMASRWLPNTPVRVIYNGSPLPALEEIHHTSTGRVLWVNSMKRVKRPEVFIELSRRLPKFEFIMVGALPEKGRYKRYLQTLLAAKPANLIYLGPVPFDEVNELMQGCDLLAYTSKAEGFGNSFIQAWLRGVPTVSLTHDVDGILERERIGVCANSLQDLVAAVESLMEDEQARIDMGRRASEYARQHHRVDRMVGDYERLFLQCLEDQASRRS